MRRLSLSSTLLLSIPLVLAGCSKTQKQVVVTDANGAADIPKYMKPGQILEWDAGPGTRDFYIQFKTSPCDGIGSNAGKTNLFVGRPGEPARCKVREGLKPGTDFPYDIYPGPVQPQDYNPGGPGHCGGCVYSSEQ